MCHNSWCTPLCAGICVLTQKGIRVNKFPAQGNIFKINLVHNLHYCRHNWHYCCIWLTIVTGTCIAGGVPDISDQDSVCLPLYICIHLVLTECNFLFTCFFFLKLSFRTSLVQRILQMQMLRPRFIPSCASQKKEMEI